MGEKLKKWAGKVAACSNHGILYGQCISKHFQSVSEGVCQKEFIEFMNCVKKTKLH